MEITILCISIASLIANIGVIGILVVVFCSGASDNLKNGKIDKTLIIEEIISFFYQIL